MRRRRTGSRRYRCLPFVLSCAAVLVCELGCGSTAKENAPIVSVQITRVVKAPIEETISADAVIFPVQQAMVVPKITSTIMKFYVQRGSRVKKGQLLAVLENSDLSAVAEQSKGELEQAEAGFATTTGAGLPQEIQKAELDVAAAKAALDAQQKVYGSRKELFQQGALPRRDLDSAEVALVQARNQSEVAQRQLSDLRRIGERETLKSVTGQLTAARGKYQGANAQLSYSVIRSPMNGVVTDRPLYAGELATSSQPLLTVMDTSRLIAKAHIGQAEALRLNLGNKTEIQVAVVDEPIKGRVTLVSPALDPGSTTVEVWTEAINPSPLLKPGITVRLAIVGHSATDALVVPTSAIFKNDEGADYVVLAGPDNRAHVAPVQIGIRNAGMSQVLSGLEQGDKVITTGGYALPDKMQIKVESSSKEGTDTKPDANATRNR